MKLTYPSPALPAKPSALRRTLCVWLFGNLGGTGLLMANFGFERPDDLKVPLLIGLLAALLSLAAAPVAYPFFALAQRVGAGWQGRAAALLGVLLGFGLAHYLLLQGLPIGPLESLLIFTWPYLAAALLTIAWLYWPQPAVGHAARLKPAAPAPLLSVWWQRNTKAHLAR